MTAALIAVGVLFVLALSLAGASVRVLREYERGVVFRFGRLVAQKGPGIVLLVPIADRMVRVTLRTITHTIQPQDVITRDNVPARVDAVAYFRVVDADASVVDIEDHLRATSEIAKTTLRSVLGKAELDTLLSERERLNEDLQRIIDEQTESWGIKVLTVEIKDVVIPQEMQRAMARQAEAERDRRAKVINAEAEFQAAARLAEAARMLSDPAGYAAAVPPDARGGRQGRGIDRVAAPAARRPRLRRQRRTAQRPPWRKRRHEAVMKMRVLIAGAGPAGVEAALTLQRIGGNRFDTTIVAPEERFVHLPPTVLSPFAVSVRGRPRLEPQAGARVRRGRVIAVDSDSREVQLEDDTITRLRRAADRHWWYRTLAVPPRARVRTARQRRAHARTDPGPRGRLRQADRFRGPAGRVLAAADLRAGADDGRARLRHVRQGRADARDAGAVAACPVRRGGLGGRRRRAGRGRDLRQNQCGRRMPRCNTLELHPSASASTSTGS